MKQIVWVMAALVFASCGSKQKNLDLLFSAKRDLTKSQIELSKLKGDQQRYIAKSNGIDLAKPVVWGKDPIGKGFTISKEKQSEMFNQMLEAENRVTHEQNIVDSLTLITR